jgi:hypothetical protein
VPKSDKYELSLLFSIMQVPFEFNEDAEILFTEIPRRINLYVIGGNVTTMSIRHEKTRYGLNAPFDNVMKVLIKSPKWIIHVKSDNTPLPSHLCANKVHAKWSTRFMIADRIGTGHIFDNGIIPVDTSGDNIAELNLEITTTDESLYSLPKSFTMPVNIYNDLHPRYDLYTNVKANTYTNAAEDVFYWKNVIFASHWTPNFHTRRCENNHRVIHDYSVELIKDFPRSKKNSSINFTTKTIISEGMMVSCNFDYSDIPEIAGIIADKMITMIHADMDKFVNIPMLVYFYLPVNLRNKRVIDPETEGSIDETISKKLFVDHWYNNYVVANLHYSPLIYASTVTLVSDDSSYKTKYSFVGNVRICGELTDEFSIELYKAPIISISCESLKYLRIYVKDIKGFPGGKFNKNSMLTNPGIYLVRKKSAMSS